MMILIDKAVLHVLDFSSGITVFSDQELTVENSVETFLLQHIEKSYQDQGLKNGQFYEDSIFKNKLAEYAAGTLSFVDFSRLIAEMMYDSIAKSDKLESVDLLFADIRIEGRRLIAFFKCNNKIGFIHQVTQMESGIKNEIINHYAILPNLSQKIDECAFIDFKSMEIRFIDKKYAVEGEELCILPECILECNYTDSPKATLAKVTAIAQKVAKNHEQDVHGQAVMKAVMSAKSLIAENAQSSDYLQPMELGKELFKASPAMQAEYQAEIEGAGIADTVKVEQDFALKKTKIHKIKTDTGIEISIPVDCFQNTDYIEFIDNPDGTLSINIKNITHIKNK